MPEPTEHDAHEPRRFVLFRDSRRKRLWTVVDTGDDLEPLFPGEVRAMRRYFCDVPQIAPVRIARTTQGSAHDQRVYYFKREGEHATDTGTLTRQFDVSELPGNQRFDIDRLSAS